MHRRRALHCHGRVTRVWSLSHDRTWLSLRAGFTQPGLCRVNPGVGRRAVCFASGVGSVVVFAVGLGVGASDGVGELAGVQVQITLGRFDPGVAKKSRDHVQVDAAGQRERGVGVPPAQRGVGSGDPGGGAEAPAQVEQGPPGLAGCPACCPWGLVNSSCEVGRVGRTTCR